MNIEGTHIVVTTPKGAQIFKAVRVVKAPMLLVENARGQQFIIEVGQYEAAAQHEREAFENGNGKPASLGGNRLSIN